MTKIKWICSKTSLFFMLVIVFSITEARANTNAITVPIPLDQIKNYDQFPIKVKQLILKAYHLSTLKLTYLYGSANPKNGGMDCSGTMHYLLTQMQINDIPRQSDEIYIWAKQRGHLHFYNPHTHNLTNLKPGDLLFWSGTYAVKRTIPITHVMIYLGVNRENKPLMFGASDGRTYLGKKMWGVSVFDFQLPNNKSKARFVGYSCIPSINCS